MPKKKLRGRLCGKCSSHGHGGTAGVIHAASSATTDCQPNDNVEALRVCLDKANIEARPLWKNA